MDRNLDNLLKEFSNEFYEEFTNTFPALKYEYSPTANYIIQIQAPNKDFGDIKIAIGFRDITVLIGEYYHTHFEQESSNGDTFDSMVRKQIIKDTIHFITEVISNKVLLRVEKRGEKLLSSSIEYVDQYKDKGYTTMIPLSGLLGKLFSKNKEIAFNTWSGVYKK